MNGRPLHGLYARSRSSHIEKSLKPPVETYHFTVANVIPEAVLSSAVSSGCFPMSPVKTIDMMSSPVASLMLTVTATGEQPTQQQQHVLSYSDSATNHTVRKKWSRNGSTVGPFSCPQDGPLLGTVLVPLLVPFSTKKKRMIMAPLTKKEPLPLGSEGLFFSQT